HVGLQEISAHQQIPAIGAKSRKFGGFTEAEVHRPLVAISRPNFLDPDSWKPTPIQPDLVKLVRSEFRKKFPRVQNCVNEESEPKDWNYPDVEIRVRGYRSLRRW